MLQNDAYLCSFLPKNTHNHSLSMRKTSENLQRVLQNTWQSTLQNFQSHEDMENLRICHSWEEAKGLWQLNDGILEEKRAFR